MRSAWVIGARSAPSSHSQCRSFRSGRQGLKQVATEMYTTDRLPWSPHGMSLACRCRSMSSDLRPVARQINHHVVRVPYLASILSACCCASPNPVANCPNAFAVALRLRQGGPRAAKAVSAPRSRRPVLHAGGELLVETGILQLVARAGHGYSSTSCNSVDLQRHSSLPFSRACHCVGRWCCRYLGLAPPQQQSPTVY